jgi:hypothetical protein
MSQLLRCRFAAVALVGATCALPAAATDTAVPSGTTAQAVPSDFASGRRVFRDKETGKLRAPDEDELKTMLEQERAASAARGQPEPTGPGAPLIVRQFPSGMRSAVLGPDFLVSIKAERRPDGKLAVTHDRPEHEHAHAQPQSTRPTE